MLFSIYFIFIKLFHFTMMFYAYFEFKKEKKYFNKNFYFSLSMKFPVE